MSGSNMLGGNLSETGEPSNFTIGQCASLASIIEVTAPKPGNVHRGADFDDASYPDFVVAATVIGTICDSAAERPLGETILAAVQATMRAVHTNTNLGTILLLAPLAKVPRSVPLAIGVGDVLQHTTVEDTRNVYLAIRAANPGGLGRVDRADVGDDPQLNLIDSMTLAAERDMVARQYAENFKQVFEFVVPELTAALTAGLSLSAAVVHVHLKTMLAFPDSLIARRRGLPVAQQAAALAGRVLDAGPCESEAYFDELANLDFWLRTDGHARNPGTTADLLAAGLFAALRDGIIKPPLRLAQL